MIFILNFAPFHFKAFPFLALVAAYPAACCRSFPKVSSAFNQAANIKAEERQ